MLAEHDRKNDARMSRLIPCANRNRIAQYKEGQRTKWPHPKRSDHLRGEGLQGWYLRA